FGAGLGQIMTYAIGRGAAKLFKDKQGVKNMQYLTSLVTRKKYWTPFLIYFFGLTPLPDQLIMIPLGMGKYPLKKALFPCSLGKATFSFLLGVSATLFKKESVLLSINDIIQEMLMVSILLSILVFCFVIEWEKIFNHYLSKKRATKESTVNVSITTDPAEIDTEQIKSEKQDPPAAAGNDDGLMMAKEDS
ncbi:MAG: hypothetical protein ACTSRA_12005, partial [Promethearchaeota archaeon]